jgi:hypothetical protein
MAKSSNPKSRHAYAQIPYEWTLPRLLPVAGGVFEEPRSADRAAGVILIAIQIDEAFQTPLRSAERLLLCPLRHALAPSFAHAYRFLLLPSARPMTGAAIEIIQRLALAISVTRRFSPAISMAK